MGNNVEKLLVEYKEIARCLENGMDNLNNGKYLEAKLEVINMIIDDLESING